MDYATFVGERPGWSTWPDLYRQVGLCGSIRRHSG